MFNRFLLKLHLHKVVFFRQIGWRCYFNIIIFAVVVAAVVEAARCRVHSLFSLAVRTLIGVCVCMPIDTYRINWPRDMPECGHGPVLATRIGSGMRNRAAAALTWTFQQPPWHAQIPFGIKRQFRSHTQFPFIINCASASNGWRMECFCVVCEVVCLSIPMRTTF